MSDLIDRQKAIDALTRTMVSIPTAGGKDLMHDENRIRVEDILVIKRLPSAEPKKGKWIPHCEISREYFGTVLAYIGYEYWFCDACGYRVENGWPMYNFCPNCGADMRGEEEACENCKHNEKPWHEEPCDSCTMGGDTHHFEPKEGRT